MVVVVEVVEVVGPLKSPFRHAAVKIRHLQHDVG